MFDVVLVVQCRASGESPAAAEAAAKRWLEGAVRSAENADGIETDLPVLTFPVYLRLAEKRARQNVRDLLSMLAERYDTLPPEARDAYHRLLDLPEPPEDDEPAA